MPPSQVTAGQAENLDELVERMSRITAQTVDSLQLAAVLESDGVTDDIAHVEFGFADVFSLAAEVRHRTTPAASLGSVTRHRLAVRGPHDTKRRLSSHGALYLLPAAVFPAVLALLSRESLVLGLVVGGGLAWVWAGGATWLAYRMLGRGSTAAAARILSRAALAGVPVAGVAGLAVVVLSGSGYLLAVVAVGQMTYQLGATVLMFYRREGLLCLAMLPAVASGLAYLLVGWPSAVTTSVVGATSIAFVFRLGLAEALGRGRPVGAVAVLPSLKGGTTQFVLFLAYTALCAAYLLHAQARYMLGSLDIAIGLLPLIAGMGVVEWRAQRFRGRTRSLLARVQYPAEFAMGVRRLLARDVVVCLAVVGAFGLVLVAALDLMGALTVAGAMMATASALLAGSYYASFLLIGFGRLGLLCAATAICLAIHALATRIPPGPLDPGADTAVFTATALLLLVLSLIALVLQATQPREHA